MVAAFRAATSTGTGDAADTGKSCAVPAGAAIDDIALLFIEAWWDTATDPVVTWPTGFSQIGYVESATDGFQRLIVGLKELTAADTGNYTYSLQQTYWNQAQCHLWSGIDLTTNLDVAIATAVTPANTTMPALNLTTVTDGCGMVHVVANENAASGTAPTGYTERTEANYLRTNTKVAGTAGSETPSGGSISVSTVKLGMLIALRPASSGTAMNLSAAAGSGTAQALAVSKAVTLGQASGAGAPQAMTFSKALPLGTAAGSGTPQGIASSKSLTLGTAAGSGTAQGLGPTKALGLENATGSGAPQAMTLTPEPGEGQMPLGTATGTGAPQAMTFSKALALSPATGSGAVQAVALAKPLDLAAATGVGTPQALSNGKGLQLGVASGAGAAQAMELGGAYTAPSEWTISGPAPATVVPRSQAFTAITRSTPYTAVTREHE